MNEDRSVRRTQATYIQENVEEKWVGWEATRLVSFMTQCAAISFPPPGFSQSSQLDSSTKMALPAGPFVASNSTAQPACCPAIESTPIPEPDDSPPMLGIDPGSETGETMSGTLHLSELVTTMPGTDVPQHAVSAGKKFNCRLGLDLTDMTCLQPGPAMYTVTIWAKKLGNKQRQVVGEGQGTFTCADKTTCTVEVTLTSEGVYRLEAIVTLTQPVDRLLPPGRWLAMQRGGWLQVY
ncbi:MAG: hypothetical protein HY870_04830 [Chloroflexi bacterium]|nr:hypothetical protein [Chloroflexota bacterium]